MIITPMLAYPAAQTAEYNRWDIQPKYDGIRMLYHGGVGTSRQGNDFSSVPHIIESLAMFSEVFPNVVLDGELYNHALKDDFDSISSMVKTQNQTPESLDLSKQYVRYYVFDAYYLDEPDLPWSIRCENLTVLSTAFQEDNVILAPTLKGRTEEFVQHAYDCYLNEGFEGIMLRNPSAPYLQCGPTERRSLDLRKKKPNVTEEFTLIGATEGKGKCQGMVGAFLLRTKDGLEFEAAPKCKFPQRKHYWDHLSDYIGKSATVRYGRLTPRGVPRFGRLITFRDYE